MTSPLAEGRLFVVETDRDRFVGRVRFVDGALHVLSGLRGHPPVVRAEDLVMIVPAEGYPDAEVVTASYAPMRDDSRVPTIRE